MFPKHYNFFISQKKIAISGYPLFTSFIFLL
nr:MAG TPA: hypothetical protein [Caudoviricetes sp.]